MSIKKITSFSGEHSFLSNFYPVPGIVLDADLYPTVEHAYQAAKTLNFTERAEIRHTNTPGEAKRLGKVITLRHNWEIIKLSVMEDFINQKFQRPILKSYLLLTGDAELIEGNTWGDIFWGVCNGTGENHLGKLLMKKRDALRADIPLYHPISSEKLFAYANSFDYCKRGPSAIPDMQEMAKELIAMRPKL